MSGSVLTACRSAGEYVADADQEVYSILAERHADLLQDPDRFRIDPPEGSLRQRLLDGDTSGVQEPLGLTELLEIAAENSSTYQDQKEGVYLEALDLTFQRYLFDEQFGGFLGGGVEGDGHEATGTDGGGGLDFSKLLGNGAVLLGNIGVSLFNDLTSGGGWDTVTTLGLTFSQPAPGRLGPGDRAREPDPGGAQPAVRSALLRALPADLRGAGRRPRLPRARAGRRARQRAQQLRQPGAPARTQRGPRRGRSHQRHPGRPGAAAGAAREERRDLRRAAARVPARRPEPVPGPSDRHPAVRRSGRDREGRRGRAGAAG